MNISQALTGVTLLAFANGAPDIVTSIVAGEEQGGKLLSIGALYGASNFVCNYVLHSVIEASPKKKIKMPRLPYLRDCVIFLVSTLGLIAAGFVGVKTYTISIFLGILYFL